MRDLRPKCVMPAWVRRYAVTKLRVLEEMEMVDRGPLEGDGTCDVVVFPGAKGYQCGVPAMVGCDEGLC